MVTSLRSKWAAGKALGGRISKSIRNRRATRPPAHFQRNPPGRGQLAVFPPPRRIGPYGSRYGRFARALKYPPRRNLRRHHHYMRDGTLVEPVGRPASENHIDETLASWKCAELADQQ